MINDQTTVHLMLIALQYFMQMAIRIDERIPCRNFSTIMILLFKNKNICIADITVENSVFSQSKII